MPPKLVLVHGAGSGPWVFEEWRRAGLDVVAVDLQEGVEVGAASMDDYADLVARACERAGGVVALCGWSMGGLVAMMAAAENAVEALVLIEPSPPAEIQGTSDVPEASGTFDPEEVYGRFPAGVRARPESARARADRKRGISVPKLPARTLVVYGDEFVEERGAAIVERYGVEGVHFPGLSHWDLVRDPRVRSRVFDFTRG